jgi:hypothetical protein
MTWHVVEQEMTWQCTVSRMLSPFLHVDLTVWYPYAVGLCQRVVFTIWYGGACILVQTLYIQRIYFRTHILHTVWY